MFLTREQATKVRPGENYFFPTSTITLSKVRPWALCIVIAQANFSGSCRREQVVPE